MFGGVDKALQIPPDLRLFGKTSFARRRMGVALAYNDLDQARGRARTATACVKPGRAWVTAPSVRPNHELHLAPLTPSSSLPLTISWPRRRTFDTEIAGLTLWRCA